MLRTWQRWSSRSRIAVASTSSPASTPGLGHALVRGDEDRAATVAVGHEAKEEARLVPAHGLEADLLDHEERDVHVLALAEPGRMPLGVALECGKEILEPVEGDGEAVLDRSHGGGDGQVRLANAGRALQEQAPAPGYRRTSRASRSASARRSAGRRSRSCRGSARSGGPRVFSEVRTRRSSRAESSASSSVSRKRCGGYVSFAARATCSPSRSAACRS